MQLKLPFFLTSLFSGLFIFPSFANSNNTLGESSDFYKHTSQMVQEQINLVARIEKAIAQPDPNQVRVVRGQILIQSKVIEAFARKQNPGFRGTCASGNREKLNDAEAEIYCGLYASSQELLKLSPLLDRILSRRGELALVRELPLVSGERKFHPVLAISAIERPLLGKKAVPFAIQEPNLPYSSVPTVGIIAKKPLADYVAPIQAALVLPPEALSPLENAEAKLNQTKAVFPQGIKFEDPKQTTSALENFAYGLDPQEPQTYAKFLELPKTGIFRVLPHLAYSRPLNTLQNRLVQTVGERYPFPSLGEATSEFNPSLTLQLVNDNFQMLLKGVDYSFMADLGDIPIEKLDSGLNKVSPSTRELFLNYQPPQQLNAIQIERRRFQTGKGVNNSIAQARIPAKLNHTYIMRSLQFQIPEAIIKNERLTPQQRLQIDTITKIQSSDTVIAFRPVRRRPDGSYTVIWRVLNQLPKPQITDLETYLRY
ncbi:hypothetical protein [Calothrix sp. PCC 6303]|uniref:hypothetical protein n=1 Tax=Calothrix sp. PCC 6303 TaxID=1170562 RepID=UPI0002A03721|nr:hypothetical protein [Calothrix sp. PCC 6303]AFZ03805.1 hypothetical protein Cal6303_4908 [Calothrix sp. PCC 6303]